MKSGHDVLQDPKLSSQPVVETTVAVLKVSHHNLFNSQALKFAFLAFRLVRQTGYQQDSPRFALKGKLSDAMPLQEPKHSKGFAVRLKFGPKIWEETSAKLLRLRIS